MRKWLCLSAFLVLALCIGQAQASTYPNARRAAGQALIDSWRASHGGRSTTVGEGSTVAGGLVNRAPVAGTGGGAKVGADGPLKVGEKTVPVGLSGEVAKDAIVGGVTGCLTGGAVGCVLGVATPLALAYVANSGVRKNPDTGGLEMTPPGPAGCGAAPKPGPGDIIENAGKPSAGCVGQYDGVVIVIDGITVVGGGNTCRVNWHCSNDTYLNRYEEWTRGDVSPTWYPATPQEVRDRLYNNDPPPGIVDELAKQGNIIWPMGPITVTGPSVVQGPKEVTTRPDGSTVERQSQTDYSYSGPTVTEGATRTTTTTKNPDGSVVSQETTETTPSAEQPDAPKDEEPAPTDTPMPPVPDFYTPKFPQGMTGVWNTRKAELMSSPLLQLKDQLFPAVGSGGTCPSWMLALDVGIADFGTHDVAPPCWIWDFARVIVLLGAALLARALIFGG